MQMSAPGPLRAFLGGAANGRSSEFISTRSTTNSCELVLECTPIVATSNRPKEPECSDGIGFTAHGDFKRLKLLSAGQLHCCGLRN